MPRPRRTIASASNTATARWLDKALNTTALHNQLKSAVSFRLPKSAACGLTEDHIQNHYLRLLEADALSKHVADEDSTAPSNMRWWAVKNAYKDIRAWGREPTLRISVGALTETDLKRDAQTPDCTARPAVHPTNPMGEATICAVGKTTVTLDLDAEDLLDDLRQRLEALVGHGNASKHLTVVLAISDGATLAEAARDAGLTPADAKRMMRQAAEVMADE